MLQKKPLSSDFYADYIYKATGYYQILLIIPLPLRSHTMQAKTLALTAGESMHKR